MLQHWFLGTCRSDAELQHYARREVRALGVSMFPDGMLHHALKAAPVLGRGTFATCYKVQVYVDSRLVDAAVKVFHKGSHLPHVVREASTYTKLGDVPCVPRLLGVSVVPPCLVTTLHGPGTLLDAARHPGTTLTALVRGLHHLADTLTQMHHRQLVHNDLKFDNVLVSRSLDTGDMITTLIDMGAVQHIGARPYQGRRLSAQTYPYLAPEVLRGGPVSPYSDAFSLGWMLSCVLGRVSRPCSAWQGMAVARQCMHPDPRQRLSVTSFRDAVKRIFLASP